ncbi:MAG: DUF305 domain-containing protein [Blastocatellia bacterium]|nr:DUF305 domain-containing protein [Blastocatellia bacterium]
MITHHAQAIEMTALIESHTENEEIRSLVCESTSQPMCTATSAPKSESWKTYWRENL